MREEKEFGNKLPELERIELLQRLRPDVAVARKFSLDEVEEALDVRVVRVVEETDQVQRLRPGIGKGDGIRDLGEPRERGLHLRGH